MAVKSPSESPHEIGVALPIDPSSRAAVTSQFEDRGDQRVALGDFMRISDSMDTAELLFQERDHLRSGDLAGLKPSDHDPKK
jgi:hypothetical protein